MPVGKEVLGRVFNLLGEPIDKLGDVKTTNRLSIHRPSPSFEEEGDCYNSIETGFEGY